MISDINDSKPLDKTDVGGSAFKSLEKLKRNEHLISDLQKDENGNGIRIIDGKK